jgi:hypothetical protein
VKTEMTGTILTHMQGREADGILLPGPPGAAKPAVAKATGNTAGIPTIAFDLAARESSLVGASTDRLPTALKIIDAVSQGRVLFVATCNSIANSPPELRDCSIKRNPPALWAPASKMRFRTGARKFPATTMSSRPIQRTPIRWGSRGSLDPHLFLTGSAVPELVWRPTEFG